MTSITSKVIDHYSGFGKDVRHDTPQILPNSLFTSNARANAAFDRYRLMENIIRYGTLADPPITNHIRTIMAD